jgi:hypothetical protein
MRDERLGAQSSFHPSSLILRPFQTLPCKSFLTRRAVVAASNPLLPQLNASASRLPDRHVSGGDNAENTGTPVPIHACPIPRVTSVVRCIRSAVSVHE